MEFIAYSVCVTLVEQRALPRERDRGAEETRDLAGDGV